MAKNFSRSKTELDRFRKANKARKRVMIARDVLAQLDAKRFIPTEGVWVNEVKGLNDVLEQEEDKDLRDLLVKQPKCEVCGLGALFVSCVEFADKLNIAELDEGIKDDLKSEESGEETGISFTLLNPYLKKYFDSDQLILIELAFEQGCGNYREYNSPLGKEAADFFDLIEDDWLSNQDESFQETKMRLIMENIIANNGTFDPMIKPEIKTVYVTPGFKG